MFLSCIHSTRPLPRSDMQGFPLAVRHRALGWTSFLPHVNNPKPKLHSQTILLSKGNLKLPHSHPSPLSPSPSLSLSPSQLTSQPVLLRPSRRITFFFGSLLSIPSQPCFSSLSLCNKDIQALPCLPNNPDPQSSPVCPSVLRSTSLEMQVGSQFC